MRMSPELVDRTLALLRSGLAFARWQLEQAEADRQSHRAAPWRDAMANARRAARDLDRLEQLARLAHEWLGRRR